MQAPAVASDVEHGLLGVWKLESSYLEVKATGEKKRVYGKKPNGYIIFTPEKRLTAIITAEPAWCTIARRISNPPGSFAWSSVTVNTLLW